MARQLDTSWKFSDRHPYLKFAMEIIVFFIVVIGFLLIVFRAWDWAEVTFDINGESRAERTLDEEIARERKLYTQGKPEWYRVATKEEQAHYFTSLCQNTYNLKPGTYSFRNCMIQEENFLIIRNQIREKYNP